MRIQDKKLNLEKMDPDPKNVIPDPACDSLEKGNVICCPRATNINVMVISIYSRFDTGCKYWWVPYCPQNVPLLKCQYRVNKGKVIHWNLGHVICILLFKFPSTIDRSFQCLLWSVSSNASNRSNYFLWRTIVFWTYGHFLRINLSRN